MTVVRDEAPVRADIIVDGRVRERPVDPVVNPARTQEIVGVVARGDAALADEAVVAARRAIAAWSASSAAERAVLLVAAADRIEATLADRATLLTREHGKVLADSRADVAGAVNILRYYADLADDYQRERVISDHRGRIVERRKAMGVVAVIVPWNYPVLLAMLMAAPALLAGNTVVVKLPEYAPLALADVLTRLTEVLPDGVLNVVAGSGAEVGAVLTRHPQVRKVMFTGSTATGRQIMRDASVNLKSLSLELGGNDPAIILAGAEIDDDLVAELLRGVFTAGGQICYAPKRMYVHRHHYRRFVEAFTAAAAELVVGDGLAPDVTMGPLNNERQFRFVQELVESSRRDGAEVREVGRRHPDTDWTQGWFRLPTVVTGLDHRAALVRQEQFGPVVPILPFDTEDEAVALANDSEYGLAASVWSADPEHAFEVARRIDAGSVFVNVHRVGASDVSMPFGGFKQSGIGRGHGVVALEECSELQVLADRTDMRRNRPADTEG